MADPTTTATSYDDDECDVLALTYENLLTGGSAVQNVALLCASISVLVFVLSAWTSNYSQVDKIWSIVPFVYAWMLCCDARTRLMAAVTTIWGLRLSYNFYRRGGYGWPPWNGDEDYRWSYIQRGGYLSVLTNPIAWTAFNLIFISVYQNVLLLLIASPSMVAHVVATTPACSSDPDGTGGKLNAIDAVAAILVLAFVAIETIADDQQYAFQTEKHRRRRGDDPTSPPTGEYKDGFCQSGLFSVVRKPNYAAEQAIWVSYYLFSVAADRRTYVNFTAVGFVLLLLLFQGSGPLTEKITLEKYPAYRQYMDRVPLYVPNVRSLFVQSRTKSE